MKADVDILQREEVKRQVEGVSHTFQQSFKDYDDALDALRECYEQGTVQFLGDHCTPHSVLGTFESGYLP